MKLFIGADHPSKTLAVPVVYVHASRCRDYGAARGFIL
jgi:hypothetical protein